MKKIFNLSILLSFFALSCGIPKYLSKPSTFNEQVNGLYIVFIMKNGPKDNSVRMRQMGEIIAVDSTNLFIIPHNKETGILRISKGRIISGEILVAGTSEASSALTIWNLANLSLIHI